MFYSRMRCMDAEYHAEWEELRRLRRRITTVAASCIVGLLLIDAVQSLPLAWNKVFGLAIFVAWIVLVFTFFYTVHQYQLWSCPRCGKPFHFRQYRLGRISNPFAGRCLNCGLPKCAETDPDPTLKHQLDPFRTDKLLGLGDTPRR
jgi:predicted RNA-binding Zn-ribbon protein involved in translation (DUF1610 family)